MTSCSSVFRRFKLDFCCRMERRKRVEECLTSGKFKLHLYIVPSLKLCVQRIIYFEDYKYIDINFYIIICTITYKHSFIWLGNSSTYIIRKLRRPSIVDLTGTRIFRYKSDQIIHVICTLLRFPFACWVSCMSHIFLILFMLVARLR